MRRTSSASEVNVTGASSTRLAFDVDVADSRRIDGASARDAPDGGVRPQFFDIPPRKDACTFALRLSQGVDEAEWGAVGNVRFCQSSNAKQTSDTPAIYPIPIIGKDAYGDVALGKTKNVVKGFDTAGSPLNRYATSGWIAPWACRILNDLFMIQLRVTAAS